VGGGIGRGAGRTSVIAAVSPPCSSNAATHSVWQKNAASCSGVQRSCARAPTTRQRSGGDVGGQHASAHEKALEPCSTVCHCARCSKEKKQRGSERTFFFAFALAPPLHNAFTHSKWPLATARCSGVSPICARPPATQRSDGGGPHASAREEAREASAVCHGASCRKANKARRRAHIASRVRVGAALAQRSHALRVALICGPVQWRLADQPRSPMILRASARSAAQRRRWTARERTRGSTRGVSSASFTQNQRMYNNEQGKGANPSRGG
jgi:hypothetical protein